MKSFRVKLLFVAILLFQAFAFSSCDIDDDSFIYVENETNANDNYCIKEITVYDEITKTYEANITDANLSAWQQRAIKLDSGTYRVEIKVQQKLENIYVGEIKSYSTTAKHLGTGDTLSAIFDGKTVYFYD